MAYKTYHWIGGSTGSTLASRFDWNVASNWRIVTLNDWGGEPIIQIPSESPSGTDTVIIGGNFIIPEGGETLVPFDCISPLLFGGFSGDVSSGGWTDSTYGATGTTYSSTLLQTIIKGNKSKENFNDTDYAINYPFKIIGGGITAGTISTLKSFNLVQGMSFSNWDYLLNNADTRQKAGLKLKTADLILETDASRGLTHHSYLKSLSGWPITVELTLVDNYGSMVGSRDIVTTVDMNCVNTKLKLLNSKVSYINFDQPTIWWPWGKDSPLWTTDSRNGDRCYLDLVKCTVENIDCKSFLVASTDVNCLIGKFNLVPKTTENGGKHRIHFVAPLSLGGTYDTLAAALALRKNPVLSGVTLANINIDLSATTGITLDVDPFNIDGTNVSYMPPLLKLGNPPINTSFPSGITFNCNGIRIVQPVVIVNTYLGKTCYPKYLVYIQSAVNIKTLDVTNTIFSFGQFKTGTSVPLTIQNLILRGESQYNSATTPVDWRIGEVSTNRILGGVVSENPRHIEPYNGRVSSESVTQAYLMGFSGASIIQADTTVNFIPYSIDGNSNTRINQYYINFEEFENIRSLDNR